MTERLAELRKAAKLVAEGKSDQEVAVALGLPAASSSQRSWRWIPLTCTVLPCQHDGRDLARQVSQTK